MNNLYFLLLLVSASSFAMENDPSGSQYKVIDGQLSVNKNTFIFAETFNFNQKKGLVTIVEERNRAINQIAILLKTIKDNQVVINAVINDKDEYVKKNRLDSNQNYVLSPYHAEIDGENRLTLHLQNNGTYEILVPHDASIKVKGIKSLIEFATRYAQVTVDCYDFKGPEKGEWREGTGYSGRPESDNRYHIQSNFHVGLQPDYKRISSFMVMKDSNDNNEISLPSYEPKVWLKTQHNKIVVKYQHDE